MHGHRPGPDEGGTDLAGTEGVGDIAGKCERALRLVVGHQSGRRGWNRRESRSARRMRSRVLIARSRASCDAAAASALRLGLPDSRIPPWARPASVLFRLEFGTSSRWQPTAAATLRTVVMVGLLPASVRSRRTISGFASMRRARFRLGQPGPLPGLVERPDERVDRVDLSPRLPVLGSKGRGLHPVVEVPVETRLGTGSHGRYRNPYVTPQQGASGLRAPCPLPYRALLGTRARRGRRPAPSGPRGSGSRRAAGPATPGRGAGPWGSVVAGLQWNTRGEPTKPRRRFTSSMCPSQLSITSASAASVSASAVKHRNTNRPSSGDEPAVDSNPAGP